MRIILLYVPLMIPKSICFILSVVLLTLTGNSCTSRSGARHYDRTLEDAAGREILLPDTIKSVVALRAGALRLLCYMDVADMVGYVEGNEKRRNTPYLMANPFLKEKEVIGAGNNFDSELLALTDADLIVCTYMSGTEADELQSKTGKPVFILEYGDMKDGLGELFNSFHLLGQLFYRQGRADSLEQFINENLHDLKNRADGNDYTTAYIGGVAYRGAHGISSTEPGYPPFSFLSVINVAGSLGEVVSSPINNQENAFIDIEQLLNWDPDYIFLDAAGEKIWRQEVFETVLDETLGAFYSGNVYSVLPYNWYTTNFENIICNSWFIGKIVYPVKFQDIVIEAKCRRIYSYFLGTDVYDEMDSLYKPFREISSGGEGK